VTAAEARVLDLFDRAIELPQADRQAWLERACGTDGALREQVRRLLEADATPHSLLDQRPGDLAGEPPDPGKRWEGRQLGPYRLVREVGHGGMGIVFLAERADVGTRVALKLVAGSVGTAERLARFDYERRILAALDDPHIARFLDAGVAHDGTPWYAMEYVEGSPIDAHTDARCLSLHDRVSLFLCAVDAVAHAHRNLLVHRDLKPSNILVSDAGIPKLVDFGIAKLLGEAPRDGSLTAEAAPGPMTPEYASPEQVRNEVVTTATDVYQLGMVLHELLTGRRPTREDGEPLRHFDRAAGVRMIRPSTLAGMEVQPHQLPGGLSTRTARELAALRGATPAQLQRQLSGDLDAILEVALDPDPRRRYASARELADDLRRFIEGHAVNARANSRAYRAMKFVSRHRVVSLLATTLAVVLATSTVTIHLQSHRVTAERDRAEEVARVLERLVRIAAPGPRSNDSAAVRTILAQVTAEGMERLESEPETWARILEPVADIYAATTSPDTAILIWRAIIAALEPRVPSNDRVLIEALGSLGVKLVERGDFAGGVALLDRMLGDARQLPEDRRAQFATSLSYVAFGRQVAGDDAGAKRLYEEALDVASTLADSAGRTWDRTLLNLGFVAAREGDVDSAVVLLRASLQRRAARDGAASVGALNVMSGLARQLLERDSVDEAQPLVDSVLAIRRRLLSPPNALLSEALDLKARLLLARQQPADAEVLARDALAMNRRVYGDEHFLVAYAEARLAATLAEQGAIPRALALQQVAVARYRRTAGERHPGTVGAVLGLAELERRRGRLQEAERLYRDAVASLDAINPNKPALARPLTNLGELLAASGRCTDAQAPLHRALKVARRESDSSAAMAALRDCAGRTRPTPTVGSAPR
jgi:serine/threonine-protein kinase